MFEKKKTGLKIYCSLIFMFLLLYSTVVRGTSRYKNVIEGEAAKKLVLIAFLGTKRKKNIFWANLNLVKVLGVYKGWLF